MSERLSGQVTRSAAEIYEEFFVPALFAQWAPRVCDEAQLAPRQKVLDVACGTGVLSREAAVRVGSGGVVTGLDRNEGMLAVARRKAPGINWRLGRAEALPFGDESFDVVASQFGLMIFEDRAAALWEMWRVLRRDGVLAVAVWDKIERSPGYAAMAALLERLFGDSIANELRALFLLGDGDQLRSQFAKAGVAGTRISTHVGAARFPSIESWVRTEIKGWTLADLIDHAQYELLLSEAETALQPYTTADGTVTFAAPAHIVTARKA
jgi:ubiquinone/menaquinone biosynthesis C-methylase UbiE